MRILINGLSIGTGGGYTVGREVLRHIALARPDWRLTLALIDGHPLQAHFRQESLPQNCNLLWAEPSTTGQVKRRSYERGALAKWIADERIDAVFQLNGMVLPGLRVPTLAHFQDPYAYRPIAWEGMRDRLLAVFKRRANARALRSAALCGWTSNYLRELICGALGVEPRRSEVFYNGVPEAWLQRAHELPPWEDRPLEIATVSNVSPYKRQSLVIQAVARLRQMPRYRDLVYRIIGDASESYRAELNRQAFGMGVADAVVLEGRVSDERVCEVLRRARAMPLLSVCESFGIPAIEAMTFGTPVIIADCCALPEVCGEACLRCPPDDLDALVAALDRLLSDASLAQRLRHLGAERAQQFSWPRIGARMAECLEEIAGD